MDSLPDRTIADGILFVDLYQLTMAQLYFKAGMHERRAQFEYFYRSNPDYGEHTAGYCVNAGLGWLVDWMPEARCQQRDVDYLRHLCGRAGRRLFDDAFLDWFYANGNFDGIDLRAIPEGRVVHPNVPLVVVQGPLAMGQVLESSLLNHLTYQTLVATKAARVKRAARGGTILDFGLRRAHGKGANAGTRAALIGGADFTSNTGMAAALGYPPKGTHAHSMVQAFMAMGGDELEAFRAYADLYPDDCLLLVDTINTLGSGIPNAIKVFEDLERRGHRPLGIRLDSGDLAYLSIQAAKQLDAAGFADTSIVLSNELDELVIWQIITQIREEAPPAGVDPDRLIARLIYGIGTNMITSRGASALDGVCKLVAIGDNGSWQPAIKISETKAKTLNPGDKRVWRIYDRHGKATADLIGLADEDPLALDPLRLHHPTDQGRVRSLAAEGISEIEPLQVEVVRDGAPVGDQPTIEHMRRRRVADLERLHIGVKRLVNPHVYHVSLSQRLWDFKQELVARFMRPSAGSR